MKILIVLITLGITSCLPEWLGGEEDINPCPPWPVAGPNVAEELNEIPFEGNEHFYEWLDRLDKLRQQLEVCREEY